MLGGDLRVHEKKMKGLEIVGEGKGEKNAQMEGEEKGKVMGRRRGIGLETKEILR